MGRSFAIAAVLLSAVGLVWTGGCPGTGTGGDTTFNLPPVPVISTDRTRGVVPFTVSFNSDRSTDDGLIVLRQWDFGDGGTSQEIRPRHTFASTGDFTVRLTLTDEQGASATRSTIISVTQQPVAVITTDRTAADSAPAVINFSASESFDPDGEIVSYLWDFGDGSTEILPAVAHTYARPGVFRAQLTVTDDKGITGSAEVLISINIRTPTIEIRTPPDTVDNIVVEVDSPLWIQGVFTVDPGVPYYVRAGVDGDRDVCDAQTVLLSADNLSVVARFDGHEDRVTEADFIAGDAQVISSSRDGTLRLFDRTTTGLDGLFEGVGELLAVDAAPDGGTFAYGQSNGRVVIRNRNGGAVVREFSNHNAAVNAVEYSSAGNRLVTASNDRRALLFDPTTGALLREFTHDLAVNDAAISPDGTTVATCGEDNVVKIWNANSGALLATFSGHGAAVNAVAFSPDGTRIASGGDDNVVRVINLGGQQLAALSAHTDDVLSVAFSPDGTEIASGGAEAVVRVWDAATFQGLRNTTVCASPITSVQYSSDSGRLLVGVAARNAVQLDTDPGSGNDLVITYPQALRLDDVAALGGSLPTGVYYLWAEIDTDRTEPVRTYANPIVQVVPPFTSTVDSTTPVVPLFEDAASVVVSPDKLRQVMDLGSFAQGDRLFLSILTAPGFGETFALDRDYSIMIMDADQNIYAWYQNDFVLFTRDTRLIIGHSSPHYYLVTDGANGVNIRVERNTGLYTTHQQRVFVDFRGGDAVAVRDLPPQNLAPLNAAGFNAFFNTNPNFTDANDTPVLAAAVMQTLRTVYGGLNVQFVGSNETPNPPTLPYKTIYIANAVAEEADGDPIYGAADYVNPRNDTETGTGIVFALTVGDEVIDNLGFNNPPVSGNGAQALSDLGRILGTVAARDVGNLLGLRFTSEPLDLMQSEGTDADDITLPRVLKAGTPASGEQIDLVAPPGPDLPPIGIQNAPQYLLELVGPG